MKEGVGSVALVDGEEGMGRMVKRREERNGKDA